MVAAIGATVIVSVRLIRARPPEPVSALETTPSAEEREAVALLAQLHADGRIAEGLALARSLAASDPDSAWLHYSLGALLDAVSDERAAIEAYRKAVELSPGMSAAHKRLGMAHLQLGNPRDALRPLRVAAELAPEDRDIAFQLARALAMAGRYAEAEKTLTSSGSTPHPLVDSLLGVVYRNLGRPEEALAAFLRALRGDPKNLTALANYGQLLAQRGDRESAQLVLERHAELVRATDRVEQLRRAATDLGGVESRLSLARELEHQGELEGAADTLASAARSYPDDPRPAQELARVLLAEGRRAEAQGWIDHAVALDPEHPTTLLVLGLERISSGRPEEAEAFLVRSRDAAPWGADAWSALAGAQRDAGRLHDAARHYRRAIEIEPENPDLFEDLALTLLELGEAATAASTARNGLALDPDSAELSMIAGLALAADGQRDAAVRALEDAVRRQRARTFSDAQAEAFVEPYRNLARAEPGLRLHSELLTEH